jgi:hypothetical protein
MATRRRRQSAAPEDTTPPDVHGELLDVSEPISAPAIPEPQAVKGVWYPVAVRLPGETKDRQRVKMYVTPEGVYLYWAVPSDPDSWMPDWHSPMLEGQPKPPSGWKARNGFQVLTDAGVLSVTPMGGCGCGWPLKRWSPAFSRRVVAW